MVSIYQSIHNRVLYSLRNITLNRRNKKKLKEGTFDKSFSLISSNCNGAFILHDLNLRFNSPTVNLFIPPADFVEFLSHLEYYTTCPMTYLGIDEEEKCPVGILRRDGKSVRIIFVHYKTFEDAQIKWNERVKRINYNNLYCMMTERDGCTYDDLVAYDRLPYKHKVVYTKKAYPEISCAAYVPGFENEKELGRLSDYIPWGFGKRYYDFFDYTTWLLE